MKAALKKVWTGISRDAVVITIIGVGLALALRYSLRGFVSRDFETLMGSWYSTFSHQGVAALRIGVTNYPPLYEYILLLSTIIFKNISPITAIKLPFIACDLLCAWYVFRIVRLKYTSGMVPCFAALAFLFAPTVIINSAMWGQVDILYTTALVACLYYVLKNKGLFAFLAFGVAISCKPQALFLAPFLALLVLKKHISLKYVLVVPAVYLVTIIPALIVGRPFFALLTLYTSQIDLFKLLTVNAPNMYSWFPPDFYQKLYLAGMIFGASIILLYIAVAYRSKVSYTMPVLIYLAQASVLLVPFFMPKMHERYFIVSDVMSIVFAFFYPKKAYFSVILNGISFFSYQGFLFGVETIPQDVVAIFLLAAVVVFTGQLVKLLYPQVIQAQYNIKSY